MSKELEGRTFRLESSGALIRFLGAMTPKFIADAAGANVKPIAREDWGNEKKIRDWANDCAGIGGEKPCPIVCAMRSCYHD